MLLLYDSCGVDEMAIKKKKNDSKILMPMRCSKNNVERNITHQVLTNNQTTKMSQMNDLIMNHKDRNSMVF